MAEFVLNSNEVYGLVYDFSDNLITGEVIKTYNVYYDETIISGSYNGFITSSLHDKEHIITNVSGYESSYTLRVEVLSNRYNVYNKSITVVTDELDYSQSYNDFNYRFLIDGKNIFILSSQGFNYNQEYTLDISSTISGLYTSTLGVNFSSWFTSTYCPIFSTIGRVKLRGGPEIDSFSEDIINRMIHKNSIDIIDIYNINNRTNLPYNYYGCGPNGIPTAFRLYAECKTAYDLLVLVDRIGGVGQGQKKSLGDMSIQYSTSKSNSKSNDLVKELYDCFNSVLNSSPISSPTVAVKGYMDESKGYPHPMRDHNHNRVIRTVNPHTSGPWEAGSYWRNKF